MKMNVIRKDISDICRVCLEKSKKLYPLEGPILNVDVHLSTMINYCTSIEVILDEDLPKNVCLQCFKTIRIAYNFIKQFKENNDRLLCQRKINKKKPSVVFQEDCEGMDDGMLEIKEEILDEVESNEGLDNDVAEYSSKQNCFPPEENIIITYVADDNNSSNSETLLEIPSSYKNEHNLEDGEVTVKIEEQSTNELPSPSIFLNRHVCPVCCNVFMDFKRGLLKHLYHSHKNDSFKCNKCNLDVELTVDFYIQHYTLAHLYQCPICKKKLGSKSSFYYHSKYHTEDNPYRCPYETCRKSFQSQTSLQKHVQTHSSDTKYICSKCGKNFNTYDTFRYHTKTHDGKRSHLCNVCGRSFLQSVHLKYHMWHHTGVKQFHCDDCGKSYTSVTQLKKHRRKYCGSEKG